jgi:hypothetical protein
MRAPRRKLKHRDAAFPAAPAVDGHAPADQVVNGSVDGTKPPDVLDV